MLSSLGAVVILVCAVRMGVWGVRKPLSRREIAIRCVAPDRFSIL